MFVVWTSIMIAGIILMLIINPEEAFSTILAGSENSITLSLKLWGIYAVWLGILKIIEDTGLDKKIGKLLSPLIKLLFGKTSPEAKNFIAVNLTSNLLGMGNACTPSGIEGMRCLDKGDTKITNQMAMFFILNTTCLQLIPSTVIGLRTFYKSANPSNIILPTLIASAASTVVGVILVAICSRFRRLKKDKLPSFKSGYKA